VESSASLGILFVASITAGSVYAAPRRPACVEIMASCEQAGFVRGDAKAGDGLFIDCVLPIVRGTPQRRRASKPLPEIELRATCRASIPTKRNPVQASPRPTIPEGTPTHQRTPPPPSPAVEPPVQPNVPATPMASINVASTADKRRRGVRVTEPEHKTAERNFSLQAWANTTSPGYSTCSVNCSPRVASEN
jgi:hypothetical protein